MNLHPPKKSDRPPLVLIILDGWGVGPNTPDNAIAQAKTPTLDYLKKEFLYMELVAHGESVGLPKDQVGNSEAGHMNIGAGRVVQQDAVYISDAIEDGTFSKNPAFLEAIQHVQRKDTQLHMMGILSGDQCPHVSPDHIIALSKLAAEHKVRIVWHLFTDGRDSPIQAAMAFWKDIQPRLAPGTDTIATVAGRVYLDRKKNWKWTETLYNMLVLGVAPYECSSFNQAVNEAYRRGESDEFISPTLIRNKEVTAKDTISDGDSIIFFNLRSDRARQLTKPFVQQDFESKNQGSFTRSKVLEHIKFVAMTDFGPDLGEVLSAFPSRDVKMTMPMALDKEYRQLYISEMEKYAHITYFVNGGYEEPVAGEERVLVQSKNVRCYDETPEMSAKEITQIVTESLRAKLYEFVCINYPNADMLGHTGNVNAAIQGVECVDKQIKEILEIVRELNGELLITADHGNAEIMRAKEPGKKLHELINTMHERTGVPFYMYTDQKVKLKPTGFGLIGGRLGDVVPTMLDLVGIKKPKEMTGNSLLAR